MSTFLFILLVIGSASFLCALLIISAAVVSSRSTKRLSGKQLADLTEEAQALQNGKNVSTQKQQEHSSTRMALH